MNQPEIYARFALTDSPSGYYREPTVHQDQVVFVCEDNLWLVPLTGGIARQITAGEGRISAPKFSPCGQFLAFTSTEEGCPEVFVMPARGGAAQKLTFSGAQRLHVAGWSPDGESIYFRANLQEPFRNQMGLYAVPRTGGAIKALNLGPAQHISFQPDGPGRVLARHANDLARWKHYRGGAAGELWIDLQGQSLWTRLLPENTAGMCRPMWIKDRIYFLTDEHDCANLYSVLPDGSDRCQHTHQSEHYLRFASHHDQTIVMMIGADLYAFHTHTEELQKIEIDYASPKVELKPRFVSARDYLDDFSLHPQGHSLTMTARGKALSFGHWEGAIRQHGKRQGVRYRLATYLNDGERILVISDEAGEEHFEIYTADGSNEPRPIDTRNVDLGRPLEVLISPVDDCAVFTNHRHELVHLDLETGETFLIDRSDFARIAGLAYSPDGRWLAYGFYQTESTSVINIYDLDRGEIHQVTSGEFQDLQPSFDPQGRYLYFLSYRHFDPVYDQLYFELSFPRGMKPCVVTLRPDLDSPFLRLPAPLESDEDDDEENDKEELSQTKIHGGKAPLEKTTPNSGKSKHESGATSDRTEAQDKHDDESEIDPVEIDFEHILERIETFPVREGNYEAIAATGERVFWTVFPVSGSLGGDEHNAGFLQFYDLKKKKVETFSDQALSFDLDQSAKTIALWDGDDIWVSAAAGDGPDHDTDSPSRESGLVDLDRLSLAVDPRAEWAQMLRETWRLMRDHFWRADMGGLDWDRIWTRYKNLLPRIATRSELSDLIWTMQGELGTSHAYEMGGDYRIAPQYQPGFLGAELTWDDAFRLQDTPERFPGGYRITNILRADVWNRAVASPLLRPGAQIRTNDVLLGINGQRLSRSTAPGELLANQADREVELLIAAGDGSKAPRNVTVKTLADESDLRYRHWVETNRKAVHAASNGQLGYVHIPDMGPTGFAEFHRQFLSEKRRPGLIVDVRHNGGGHVSQLILEKLARKPLGFELQRWGKASTYPADAIGGPIVALTDENAGSDGDVFSHCFKLMKLGPLVGKRTWGGVVGIYPRHELVDGSITTQPEFSCWFKDVGFGLENWGTEPDLTVERPPEAKLGADDPQLAAAIACALELLMNEKLLTMPEITS